EVLGALRVAGGLIVKSLLLLRELFRVVLRVVLRACDLFRITRLRLPAVAGGLAVRAVVSTGDAGACREQDGARGESHNGLLRHGSVPPISVFQSQAVCPPLHRTLPERLEGRFPG